MSKHVQSWLSRVAAHRVPVAISIVVGSIALSVGTFVGPVGGGLPAFSKPQPAFTEASTPILSVDPSAIAVCGDETADVTLHWNIPAANRYKLYKNNAAEPFKQGVGPGTYEAVDVVVGNTFRIDSYVTRIQITRSRGRIVRTPVQVKNATSTVAITLDPETDCSASNDGDAVSPLNGTFKVRNIIVGGSKQHSDFSFQVDGNITFQFNANGVNDQEMSVGTHTVAAMPMANYTPSYNNCANVLIAAHQTATCTVAHTFAATPSNSLTCAPTPATVKVGEWITLTGSNGSYPSYVFDTPEGMNRSGNFGTTMVIYQTPGTKTITVISGGDRATCKVVVTGAVVQPPPPANVPPVSAVDTADCDRNLIKGWAIDPNTPNTAIQVRLLDGSTVLATGETNQDRPDVNTYFAANYNAGEAISGNHGFSFDLTNHRADGKVHLFSLEAADSTTGVFARINLVSSANMVCQPITLYKGSIDLSYTQTVLIDKFNYSTITNTDNRDATTVTYKYDTVTVGDTIEVCPGPDGKPGRQNITVSGWGSPNGANITVTDSVSGQEKWFATWYGPTPQKSTWTAYLGPNQSAVTYTFKLTPGPNTVITKTVQVRPMTGACDPGEYSQIEFVPDGVPYCPTKKQYPSLYARIVVTNAPSQPPRTVEDAIVLKFRPWGQPDIPQNYQTISVRLKGEENYKSTDPNTFVFRTEPYKVYAKGYYMFVLNFRGKTIHQTAYEHVVGNSGPFCESGY